MKIQIINVMRQFLMYLILFAVTILSIPNTFATSVTMMFEGDVTHVDAPLEESFSIGESFSGSYSFDLNTPDFTAFPGENFFIFKNAITAMSFISGNYRISSSNTYSASSTLGDINYDFDFESTYSANFKTVSGSSVGDFKPSEMTLSWEANFSRFSDRTTTDDAFFAAMFPWDIETLNSPEPPSKYFDGDGKLIYTPEEGILGNPYQPLFFDDGTPARTVGGRSGLWFVFLDVNGQESVVKGVLSSVTVVDISNTEDGLLAHWLLESKARKLEPDISGNGFYGYPHRNELGFDGIDDYIEAKDRNALNQLIDMDVSGNAMTLAALVRSVDLANCLARDCRIISKATGTRTQNHYWMLSTIKVGNQTRLRFRLKTNGLTSTLIASSGDLKNGETFHVAATYDGNTMRLYKDGVEVGRLAKTGNINTNNKVKTWIGSNPPVATSRPWKGDISDVRIYNKALTEEEVNEISEKIQ